MQKVASMDDLKVALMVVMKVYKKVEYSVVLMAAYLV